MTKRERDVAAKKIITVTGRVLLQLLLMLYFGSMTVEGAGKPQIGENIEVVGLNSI